MCTFVINVLLVLILSELSLTEFIGGYKWVPANTGNASKISSLIVRKEDEISVRFARARKFNDIILGEVKKGESAKFSSCLGTFNKDEFEMLDFNETFCKEWKTLVPGKDSFENIVRGGTAKNGEPLFVGRQIRNGKHYASDISLTSINANDQFLVCKFEDSWVDTEAQNIPQNAVSGGYTSDGDEIFVARIEINCTTVPGQVIPNTGVAEAKFGGIIESSKYYQVLVESSIKYSWISSGNGQIPDYAVVGGTNQNFELMYVARFNYTSGYLTFKDALLMKKYQILVRNV